jgi:hypothetical protein
MSIFFTNFLPTMLNAFYTAKPRGEALRGFIFAKAGQRLTMPVKPSGKKN